MEIDQKEVVGRLDFDTAKKLIAIIRPGKRGFSKIEKMREYLNHVAAPEFKAAYSALQQEEEEAAETLEPGPLTPPPATSTSLKKPRPSLDHDSLFDPASQEDIKVPFAKATRPRRSSSSVMDVDSEEVVVLDSSTLEQKPSLLQDFGEWIEATDVWLPVPQMTMHGRVIPKMCALDFLSLK